MLNPDPEEVEKSEQVIEPEPDAKSEVDTRAAQELAVAQVMFKYWIRDEETELYHPYVYPDKVFLVTSHNLPEQATLVGTFHYETVVLDDGTEQPAAICKLNARVEEEIKLEISRVAAQQIAGRSRRAKKNLMEKSGPGYTKPAFDFEKEKKKRKVAKKSRRKNRK